MKLIKSAVCIGVMVALTGRIYAQNYIPLLNERRMEVIPCIEIQAYPISISEVRLLQGPFKAAMEADRKWLMSLQPDRFLHRFHENAGFTPKAPMYDGWEDSSQSGFSFGHYLSAMSMLYAATGDNELLGRIEYSINEIRKCQLAIGTGYVAAIPDGDRLWNELVADKIEPGGSWINGFWAPWYNLHKLWSGFIDVYLYTGVETAKTVAIELTDWACDKFRDMTDDQWQRMISCETGGMNDALYNMYAITGNLRYLQLADKFYHYSVMEPLSQQRDELNGLHANTQIPKVTGMARSYELRGREKDKTIATFFWNTVLKKHTYCIGGNSNYEHFGKPGELFLSDKTTETCNTYNMLKLTGHLFAWEPKAEYMDYYERALYNHILASQNHETGMVVYSLPLAYASFKEFSTPEHSFWCCVGTGFENHVKYAEGIYSESENDLYINLFVASRLNWRRKGMIIEQQTEFPESDKSSLILRCAKSQTLTLYIRYPQWATTGYTIKVNDKIQEIEKKPGSYISLNRLWKDGDKIEIEMPKSLHKEVLPGDEHKFAFLNGPIVLAGEMDLDERKIVFLEKKDSELRDWIQPSNRTKTSFITKTGFPKNVELVPLYKKSDGHYSVYFDCYEPSEWEQIRKQYEEEDKFLREQERRTLDYFRPNEQQPETDHRFRGENVERGIGASSRKWCQAYDGGNFSFEMKVDPHAPVDLVLTYWGDDGADYQFDILIDDQLISSEVLTGSCRGEYFDKEYAIPFNLTQGKSEVVVTLHAHRWKKAGRIFGGRIMLRK